jgi:hypothetical protein
LQFFATIFSCLALDYASGVLIDFKILLNIKVILELARVIDKQL